MDVVLTGPSRGIGRATALVLARRGCRLALLGRPSPAHDEAERELREQGADCTSFQVDLADLAQVERVAAEVVQTWGVPAAVVHNAAVIHRNRIVNTSNEQLLEQLTVNLTAPAVLTRALLPPMLAQGSGRHIYVASISSTLGTAAAAAYCASKWGLVGFMKSLAEELKDTGLMTAAVLPGSVDTQMLAGSGFEPRIRPEEVAQTLVHYALDAPMAHNGAVIEMFGV